MSKNENTLVNKKSFIQLIKFALIGVLNTLVDIIVYSALVWVFNIKAESVIIIALFNIISYSCGMLNSFVLYTHWTFKSEYKRTKREFIEFIILNVITCVLSYALQLLLKSTVFSGGITEWACELIKYDDINKMTLWLSKILATGVVLVFNFVGSKLLVFNKK